MQLITGVFVIANFVGEQNAMPTPVATQVTLLVVATGSIVGASAAFAIGHCGLLQQYRHKLSVPGCLLKRRLRRISGSKPELLDRQ